MKRLLGLLLLVLFTTAAEATTRCTGTMMQSMTVDSGQQFTLPIAAVPGALDYQIAASPSWSRNGGTETWMPGPGTVFTTAARPTGAPQIIEHLYNASPNSPSAVYFTVTASNAYDPSFVPCAQDVLVAVNPDAGLGRDATRAVVPVAGSLTGANNSIYRTRLTIQNLWSGPISGHITFHSAGTAGTPDDPSIGYNLAPNAVQSWDDVVAAAGAHGLGSLDIVPDMVASGTYPLPQIRAEVVSVQKAGAANGFGTDIPAVTPTSETPGGVWIGFNPSLLVDDAGGARRVAFGVRTLAEPVTLTAFLVAADGTPRATVTRDFPADYQEQKPIDQWFGVPAQQFDRIILTARRASNLQGGLIPYLSETDNVTNDVSLVLPARVPTALEQPIVQCTDGIGCNLLVR